MLREHRINLNSQIDYGDFDVFFSTKLNFHDELDGITISTRRKVCQVVFRILLEVGLLNKNNEINSIIPNIETIDLLGNHDLEITGLFPSYDQAITNKK